MVEKYVNLVDLIKSFPANICLQNRLRYSRERAVRSLLIPTFPVVINTALLTLQDLDFHSARLSICTIASVAAGGQGRAPESLTTDIGSGEIALRTWAQTKESKCCRSMK